VTNIYVIISTRTLLTIALLAVIALFREIRGTLVSCSVSHEHQEEYGYRIQEPGVRSQNTGDSRQFEVSTGEQGEQHIRIQEIESRRQDGKPQYAARSKEKK
jgi:hypothetical protein